MDHLADEDAGGLRLARSQACYNPCPYTFDSIDELDFSDVQKERLSASLDAYQYRQGEIPREASEVQGDVARLNNVGEDGVSGLEEAVNHGTSNKLDSTEIDPENDLRGLQGLDGEVDGATNVLDNPDRTLDGMEVDVSNSYGESEIDLDLREKEGIAVEVKNIDYGTVPNFEEARETAVEDLVNKLEVITHDPNVDSYVIATPTDNPRGNHVIKAALDQADIDSSTDVTFRTVDELSTL